MGGGGKAEPSRACALLSLPVLFLAAREAFHAFFTESLQTPRLGCVRPRFHLQSCKEKEVVWSGRWLCPLCLSRLYPCPEAVSPSRHL